MKYCSGCGSKLKENIKFCSECGSEISSVKNDKSHDVKPKWMQDEQTEQGMALICVIIITPIYYFSIKNFDPNWTFKTHLVAGFSVFVFSVVLGMWISRKLLK
jgi:uncharacterized membrane protein YvbJ